MLLLQKPVRSEWRSWFAWHPVTTIDNEIIWLERVNRKMIETEVGINIVVYKRITKPFESHFTDSLRYMAPMITDDVKSSLSKRFKKSKILFPSAKLVYTKTKKKKATTKE